MDAPVKTVLFDIDGTLDDSNDAHANSWVDALREAGYEVPFARVRPLIGMGSDKLVPKLSVALNVSDEPGKSIVARRKEIFLERYLPSVRAFPASRELVASLKEAGYCLVVASSASKEELDPLLRIANVSELFDHATTPDEVEETKPDPDVVAAGMAWSHSGAAETLMIGDTKFDVEAARRAGARSIALRCGGSSDADLAQATAIYDSPADLLAALNAATLDELLAARQGGAEGSARPSP